MTLATIDGEAAWKGLAGAAGRQWADIAGRFAHDPFDLVPAPGFALDAKSRFFCLGSCFARNIEEHLIYRGVEVLSKKVVSPKAEWPARANGFLNKFTTHSMVQELRWLAQPPVDPADHLLETGQGWRDLHLTPGLQGATRERALERRRWLAAEYFPRIASADVLVMTLGLNEVWRDTVAGTRLNAAPGLREVRREPGRFVLEITDVEENVAALEEARTLARALNPAMKIVVTVSPVPMGTTFSGRDIAIANTLSKATLRAAADAFQMRHDDVDYFPSFEIATLSSRGFAYAPDCLHVADRVVSHIMGRFLDSYLGEATPRLAPEGFTELQYLDANPDVEDRVRSGELTSGFEHWRTEGEAEGRPMRTAELTERAARAGS